MIKCIMVIAVGEKDNNGYSTEFFRVMKEVKLMIPPQINTFIEYEEGKLFRIDTLEQAPVFGQIYLYSYSFKSRYEYYHDPEKYNELKEAYIKDGWSETKGGLPLMNTVYKKEEQI